MELFAVLAAGAFASAASFPRLRQRLELSRAKHPSLRGHARMSRQLAKWIPYWEYDESQFFSSDAAPVDVVKRRREGFRKLEALYQQRFAQTAEQTAEAAPGISDLQFTSTYRVPFQFSRYVRERLRSGSFLQASSGVQVTDLDGNSFYDLTGAYGVNVFGYDFYKACVDQGIEQTRELGPVLGPYHPVVADNVERLKAISGMDEVSFHMSGTEAVMQAVRLARYHTGRQKLVRFCGAYHGWWDDVQPGVGNPHPVKDTYTLKDMDPDTLKVLRTRNDLACVLVNPLQALHPNMNAPGDSMLVSSDRWAHFDKAAYAEWLQELRQVCTERGIALILDEVFVGFRLAYRGAQEFFGISADLVTYGKTLGGGLPVGAVCGKSRWMKRFRKDRPADICFARGTFNSHPYVMGAMNAFLQQVAQPPFQQAYQEAEALWNRRIRTLNDRLRAEGLPVDVVNLMSIGTLRYTHPSRYNWMLQYYLRAEGLALSWVGTGRLIFSHNYDEETFAEVCDRLVRAARKMEQDGWWWRAPELTNQSIKRQVLRELLTARFF